MNFYYEIFLFYINIIITLLLSQTTLSRYFSWPKSDSYRSGFKSLAAVISVLCDVPNTVVFCTESIGSFPVTASQFFFNHFDTIPMYPITTGIIMHFMFHIRFISIHKLLTSFFSAFFCVTFMSADNTTSISTDVFLLFAFIYIWSTCHHFIIWVYPSLP